MIKALGGNEETVESVKKAIGRKITSLAVADDELKIGLGDETLVLKDGGQSCCEHRYMQCDDDLKPFIGAELRKLELRDGPSVEKEGDPTDCQFLVVETSEGAFTCANYNRHNGYYGGFYIEASLQPTR